MEKFLKSNLIPFLLIFILILSILVSVLLLFKNGNFTESRIGAELAELTEYSELINNRVEPTIEPTETPTPTVTPTPTPTSPPVYNTTPAEVSKINTTEKFVVFTFDGGAGIHSYDEIVQVLDNFNVKSTFFVTGKWIDQNPNLITNLVNKGHEVYNHTYNHPDLRNISDAQIIKEFSDTENAFKNLTGKTTKPYFRPPYGGRNQHVLDVAAGQGYRSIYWTVDALDWKPGITESEVKNRILTNVTPGAIYLMHIGDDITGNVLTELFTKITDQGYEIRSLGQSL